MERVRWFSKTRSLSRMVLHAPMFALNIGCFQSFLCGQLRPLLSPHGSSLSSSAPICDLPLLHILRIPPCMSFPCHSLLGRGFNLWPVSSDPFPSPWGSSALMTQVSLLFPNQICFWVYFLKGAPKKSLFWGVDLIKLFPLRYKRLMKYKHDISSPFL